MAEMEKVASSKELGGFDLNQVRNYNAKKSDYTIGCEHSKEKMTHYLHKVILL